MKVGFFIRIDLEYVEVVWVMIGEDIKFMVDVNYVYFLCEVIELVYLIEFYDISWFEEFIFLEFYDQYSELRSNMSIFIVGGECEYFWYGYY